MVAMRPRLLAIARAGRFVIDGEDVLRTRDQGGGGHADAGNIGNQKVAVSDAHNRRGVPAPAQSRRRYDSGEEGHDG